MLSSCATIELHTICPAICTADLHRIRIRSIGLPPMTSGFICMGDASPIESTLKHIVLNSHTPRRACSTFTVPFLLPSCSPSKEFPHASGSSERALCSADLTCDSHFAVETLKFNLTMLGRLMIRISAKSAFSRQHTPSEGHNITMADSCLQRTKKALAQSQGLEILG